MTKTQLLIKDLLKNRKEQVETYRANREYGEWSCGQQDADSEADEYGDKSMYYAFIIVNGHSLKLTPEEFARGKEVITEVVDDFKLSAQHYFDSI